MIVVDDKTIKLSKGDTLYLGISFNGDVPSDDTIAIFSIKQNSRNPESIIEKTHYIDDGKIDIILESEDTNSLDVGNYIWDVRLKYSNGDVFTPFKPALFQLMEAVGNV